MKPVVDKTSSRRNETGVDETGTHPFAHWMLLFVGMCHLLQPHRCSILRQTDRAIGVVTCEPANF